MGRAYPHHSSEVERRRLEVGLRQRREAECTCHSMFDASIQGLFNLIYGSNARLRSRSMSPHVLPTRRQPEDFQGNAVSLEEKLAPAQTPSSSVPTPEPSPSAAVAVKNSKVKPNKSTQLSLLPLLDRSLIHWPPCNPGLLSPANSTFYPRDPSHRLS